MSSNTMSFKTRLSRHTAAAFSMQSDCRSRNCRRARRCEGTVSADGLPHCIAALKDCNRQFFAMHVDYAAIGAEHIRKGERQPPAKDSSDAFAENLGLCIAACAFGETPANRAVLRKHLRAMKVTNWPRLPRRVAMTYHCFGLPPLDAQHRQCDAASRP